jgi:hypothetical protein
MLGYLKCVGVIAQCLRCYSLRNLRDEPRDCPTCKSLLKVSTVAVRLLSLVEPSDDILPPELGAVGCVTAEMLHEGGQFIESERVPSRPLY